MYNMGLSEKRLPSGKLTMENHQAINGYSSTISIIYGHFS